jgi:hypothetical protein
MTKPSSLAPLIDIAGQAVAFTSLDGQAFVRLPGSGFTGFYILPVRSRAFRNWFFYQFFSRYQTVPTVNAFHAMLNHLEAQGAENDHNRGLAVFRRVGSDILGIAPRKILLDLANPQCQFVEITPEGWKTTAGPGVLLEPSRSTYPRPPPTLPADGTPPPLESLRTSLNLQSRSDFLRCLAWLLSAFRPNGPFPFLILQGPPSSGKTVAARILRGLIDPSSTPLSPIPSTVRDLLPIARHNWVLAFDHISGLSKPLAEALCRLSSGLGLSLHETARPGSDPLLKSIKRPILLTVTDQWSCPADIAERALTVTFPSLAPADRRSETELFETFQPTWPEVLGALCTAVSTALDRMSKTNLATGHCPETLAWALAASPALGCTEEEMREAFAPAPPLHPMVEAVRNLLDQRRHFTGTATELLDLLKPVVSCGSPKVLSEHLRNSSLTLADSGIELKFSRLTGGTRIIEISDAPNSRNAPGASLISDPASQPQEINNLEPA